MKNQIPNEVRFMRAANLYAVTFACKPLEEIRAKQRDGGIRYVVPRSDRWSEEFFFSGKDKVTVKHRLSDDGGAVYPLSDFVQWVKKEVAYA